MGEFRVTINPKNKPATPEVNWQQARVLEMQAEYAAATLRFLLVRIKFQHVYFAQ